MPSSEPGPGRYEALYWQDNPVWAALGFAKTEPHGFHFDFIAINETTGFGACAFTVQALGDLDADFVFSTYELRGTIGEKGLVVEPLFVDLADE